MGWKTGVTTPELLSRKRDASCAETEKRSSRAGVPCTILFDDHFRPRGALAHCAAPIVPARAERKRRQVAEQARWLVSTSGSLARSLRSAAPRHLPPPTASRLTTRTDLAGAGIAQSGSCLKSGVNFKSAENSLNTMCVQSRVP